MLAEEQARLRAEQGWTYRELGEKVRFDHTYLHDMEKGRSLGGPEVIKALDELYGTEPHLTLLWKLARDSAFRDKYLRYMQLEARATVMHKYSLSVLTGLLQTADYARELLRAAQPLGGDVEDQVTARLSRQEHLTGENPADFRAILDEAVLRRPMADRRQWQTQLHHLVEMSERPNVTVQVLPFSVGAHGLTNTDTMLLWLPNGRPVGYVETGYSGDLTEEPRAVERLRLAYDRLRDLALPPRESVAFIEQLMEDIPCEPPEAV
ncbi:helix-turn-helix transcriptional regulator [Streptomyces xiamenensis]|uniref:helix-turn-helix transcriptional regulator n=1 Tax=Streptomyces xiamenensis TaxID=408015 RepID=UPI0037D239CF